MNKKPFIAGNWKMNKTHTEAVSLVQTIKAGVSKIDGATTVICPTFVALQGVASELEGTNIELGAQNMHHETDGAYTGEIAADMLKELRCRYVILGHSERRSLFGETDEFINKKVKTALKYSLIPILCIGEVLTEREAGQHFDVVKQQLEGSLAGLSGEEIAKVVVAYEPVWAIGTGVTASPEQAEEMHAFIRSILVEKCGEESALKMNILYGGSVKPDNIATLIEKNNVDGALVGGASLKAESFIQIVSSSLPEVKEGAGIES